MDESLNFKYISMALEERGTIPAEPASGFWIEKLTAFVSGPLSQDLLSMYRSFNGFADCNFDVATYISIWPISRVISDTPKFYKSRISFADIAMDAEVLTIEPSGENGSIFDLYLILIMIKLSLRISENSGKIFLEEGWIFRVTVIRAKG